MLAAGIGQPQGDRPHGPGIDARLPGAGVDGEAGAGAEGHLPQAGPQGEAQDGPSEKRDPGLAGNDVFGEGTADAHVAALIVTGGQHATPREAAFAGFVQARGSSVPMDFRSRQFAIAACVGGAKGQPIYGWDG